jgi:molybdenum cofactor biosynthesis protein B
MSHTEHRAASPASVRCAVLTISDTRTEQTDTGGAAIVSLLEAAGHVVAEKRIVRDEPDAIRAWIVEQSTHGDVPILITTGGTGITSRDGTYEVATALIEKPLPGFGELFRMLSYQDIGPAAMLSRACAGRVGHAILICLPGSEKAVRLAVEKLLLPELGHLVREATR